MSSYVSEALAEKEPCDSLLAVLDAMDREHGKPGAGRAGMGPAGPRPVVFDAGALIRFDGADGRMRALVRLARYRGVPPVVPGRRPRAGLAGRQASVVTSDPGDLRRLDPAVEIEAL